MEHTTEPHDGAATTASSPAPFGAPQLLGIALLAAVAALCAFSVDHAIPVLAAFGVAVCVPKRHGWNVRIPIGVMAGLMALFVAKMWPGAEAVEAAAGAPEGAPVEAGHLLSWLLAVPLLSAVAILFVPRQSHGLLRGATLLSMLVTLGVSLPLLKVPMGRAYHFNEDVVWIERFGIHYHVAIDGISLWLVLLTTFITPIAAYVSFGPIEKRLKDWCFALLLLEGGMLGSFLALDLFLFYVFWELGLVPMYVMIGVWGGSNRIKSAIKFFLYTMFGSVLMLVAILYLGHVYTLASGGAHSFDYFDLQRLLITRKTQVLLWAAFTLAFVIKVPMFPVHTWLPDAHTEAPTAGSILLAAVMLKMGTYGYLRFSMGLFPEASAMFAPNLAGVAVLGGIVYGALCAWKQDDIKRLIAYSSVAHLGYVMLGLFAMTGASLEGSVLQMVNHGISTGLLFLLFGVIYDRRHTRNIDAFGGLAKPMPVYATFFVVATLASVGLPGTNGFVGEFMVITGTFVSNMLGHFNGVQAAGAAFGVILGAVYMLMVVQKMFFGPVTHKENRRLPDMTAREILAASPLAMMIFVIGFFPNVFLSQIKDAATRVREDFEERVLANPAPDYYVGPLRLAPPRAEAIALRAPKPAAEGAGEGAGAQPAK
jgi:NADH-quinone oxidoreductase subunit M